MGMAVYVLGEPWCWWCPRHHLAQGLERMGWASVGLCSHLRAEWDPTGLGWGDFALPTFTLRGRGFAVAQGYGGCSGEGSSPLCWG